jgi:hypothetical protein
MDISVPATAALENRTKTRHAKNLIFSHPNKNPAQRPGFVIFSFFDSGGE